MAEGRQHEPNEDHGLTMVPETGYGAVHPALLTAMQRLDEFATLPAGWDTYDAAPITATAIRMARHFLRTLADRFADRTEMMKPYFVAPLPYGGVQIEWHGPDREIEVDIEPDGRFGYLVTTGHGPDRVFEECDDASFEAVSDLVAHLCDGD